MIDPAYLSTVEDLLVNVMFTDTCTIYNKTSDGTGGLGASDGMGGFSDGMGGSTTSWDAGTQYPCKMDAVAGTSAAALKDVDGVKTRQLVYVPASAVASKGSRVSVGGRDFYVVDIFRETGEVDITLLVETLTDGVK